MYQFNETGWSSVLAPFLVIGVLLFLMGFMVFCYLKLRVFLIYLVVYLFSLVIGALAIGIDYLPFTPFFQIFFLLIQTILFLVMSTNLLK